MANNNKFNPVKTGSPVTGSLVSSPMNIRTHVKDTGEQSPGERANEHTRRRLTKRANMSCTPDNNIFVVPFEIFQALTEIEQVVIRVQEARGEVRVIKAPKEVS
jgi:hypothetical protein